MQTNEKKLQKHVSLVKRKPHAKKSVNFVHLQKMPKNATELFPLKPYNLSLDDYLF